ncbi:MAG: hypothetical protein HY958_08855 [Bacteroidia bacterium]|nr:hypothetical protein [Bacteroidia bacterium]
MKKLLFSFIYCWLSFSVSAQPDFNIKLLDEFQWGGATGIPYKIDYGENTCVSSFEMLGDDKVAFLCPVSNSIKIFNLNLKNFQTEIPIARGARDFIFVDGKYYVLYSYKIVEYNEHGFILNIRNYNRTIKDVTGLKFINNTLYLLSYDQKTYPVADETLNEDQVHDGWMLDADLFGKTLKKGNNQFDLVLAGLNGIFYKKTFHSELSLGAIKIL